MKRVDGKIALVTGGASGIGRATVLALAREGARVAITDLQDQTGEDLASEINNGGDAFYLHHDVRKEADWERVIAATAARWGRLDILVNNAGISGPTARVDELTLEQWREVTAINLDGVFLGVKHGIRAMRESGGGSIVNISSILGLIGMPRTAAYAAAKAGVKLLTKVAALECARGRTNIRVNSVHPGFIETPMLQAGLEGPMGEKWAQTVRGLQPAGAAGEAANIAEGVLHLASDSAKFMTGSELVIDGGLTAQ